MWKKVCRLCANITFSSKGLNIMGFLYPRDILLICSITSWCVEKCGSMADTVISQMTKSFVCIFCFDGYGFSLIWGDHAVIVKQNLYLTFYPPEWLYDFSQGRMLYSIGGTMSVIFFSWDSKVNLAHFESIIKNEKECVHL